MKLVKDGPDIPNEVIQDLEDGKLIFFCGAGISFPAGLPGFEGLVKQVYERLNEDMEPQEKKAFDAKSFDRVLGLLEARLHRPSEVRQAVKEILDIKPSTAKRQLRTHEALLTLSKQHDGAYRIVTTNFDRGFLLMDRKDLHIDFAPKLPVPKKHRWNSLVHVHGLLSDEDPEGRHLVLTSADFGAAYLTERWASRFVSELFRRFTVLFVGYSVDDPVIRYMMDAIAADRQQGDEQAQKAYVLAPSSVRRLILETQEWQAKGIQPIIYNKKSNHVLLHRTLKAWAALHRDGLLGKEGIIHRYAPIPPVPPYDETVHQVIWALSEPSGHIAHMFASLDKEPPIEWLEVLDENGLLSQPNLGVDPYNRIPIADHGYLTSCPAPLNPITRALSLWLARHINKTKLLRWVIKKGGCLHPEFRDFVRDRLIKTKLPKPLNLIWQLLSSEGHACVSRSPANWFDLMKTINLGTWNPVVKQQVVRLFRPLAQFHQPLRTELGIEEEIKLEDKILVRDFVDFNIRLCAGDSIKSIVKYIRGLPNSQEVLAEISDGLTGCLIETWDLLAAFEKADGKHDYSYVHQPSITEHKQNRGYQDWTQTVQLLRDAWRATLKSDAKAARALIERWMSIKYPLFRRLSMFGMAESDLFSTQESLAYLLEEGGWWLWSVETQREAFRLLNSIAARLDPDSCRLLSDALLQGPPPHMFREGLTTAEVKRLVDHNTWLLLAKLEQFGWTFPAEAKVRLSLLREEYDWQLRDGDRDEFPTWMESGWGFRTRYTLEQLYSMPRNELANLLVETKEDREGLLDLWRELARKYSSRAITILLLLVARNQWIEDIWHSALNGFAGEKIYIRSWRYLAPVLREAPDSFYTEAVHPLSWWLRDATKPLSTDREANYWPIWDRLIEKAVAIEPGDIKDPVEKAINTAAGILTESLFDRIWVRKPKVGDGLITELADRLIKIARGEGGSYVLCRVILASRLNVLFAIDPEWTQENLIPYFDWEKSTEAPSLWEGYLWTPTISPDLLHAIKKNLLKAVINKNQLGQHDSQICRLFAIVCLEFPETFSSGEIKNVLRAIGSKGRAAVADAIKDRLSEAEKDSGSFWQNRVEPWLKSVWPKDRTAIDSETSKSLALAAIAAGSSFERAVITVEKLLTRVDDFSFVVHMIESTRVDETPISQKYPGATLRLLDAIVSEEGKWPDEDLRKILDQLAKAEPSLVDHSAYRRLNEYLRMHNL
jgi:hypothetical protein